MLLRTICRMHPLKALWLRFLWLRPEQNSLKQCINHNRKPQNWSFKNFGEKYQKSKSHIFSYVPSTHGTNRKRRGCAQSKRNKREQGYRVHFVLNSCPSPYKNANFDTIRIGVSVFYLNTTAAKKYTTCNLSGADRESHYNWVYIFFGIQIRRVGGGYYIFLINSGQ